VVQPSFAKVPLVSPQSFPAGAAHAVLRRPSSAQSMLQGQRATCERRAQHQERTCFTGPVHAGDIDSSTIGDIVIESNGLHARDQFKMDGKAQRLESPPLSSSSPGANIAPMPTFFGMDSDDEDSVWDGALQSRRKIM